MKRIGILVESVNLSQKGILINYEIGALSNKRQDFNIIVFYQLPGVSPMPPQFAMMQNLQAWGYNGNFIAIDLPSAISLIPLNNSGKKIYYPLELDWLETPNLARFYNTIYNNSQIDLLARNKRYYDIMSKVWKKPLDIVEDLNHEQLATIIDRHCV
jgi:hypothetical protein